MVQTTTAGTNTVFSTTGELGDSNLLQHVIQNAVFGTMPSERILERDGFKYVQLAGVGEGVGAFLAGVGSEELASNRRKEIGLRIKNVPAGQTYRTDRALHKPDISSATDTALRSALATHNEAYILQKAASASNLSLTEACT